MTANMKNSVSKNLPARPAQREESPFIAFSKKAEDYRREQLAKRDSGQQKAPAIPLAIFEDARDAGMNASAIANALNLPEPTVRFAARRYGFRINPLADGEISGGNPSYVRPVEAAPAVKSPAAPDMKAIAEHLGVATPSSWDKAGDILKTLAEDHADDAAEREATVEGVTFRKPSRTARRTREEMAEIVGALARQGLTRGQIMKKAGISYVAVGELWPSDAPAMKTEKSSLGKDETRALIELSIQTPTGTGYRRTQRGVADDTGLGVATVTRHWPTVERLTEILDGLDPNEYKEPVRGRKSKMSRAAMESASNVVVLDVGKRRKPRGNFANPDRQPVEDRIRAAVENGCRLVSEIMIVAGCASEKVRRYWPHDLLEEPAKEGRRTATQIRADVLAAVRGQVIATGQLPTIQKVMGLTGAHRDRIREFWPSEKIVAEWLGRQSGEEIENPAPTAEEIAKVVYGTLGYMAKVEEVRAILGAYLDMGGQK